MSRMARRSFILRVLVGLFAFVPAARELIALTRQTSAGAGPDRTPPPGPTGPPPPESSTVDPRFASGTAVAVHPNEILVRTSYAGDMSLKLSSETQIWEGLWVKDIPVEVGDRITAWGRRLEDGSLVTEKLWINAVNLRGTVREGVNYAAPIRLRVEDPRQGEMRVIVASQTGVVDFRGASRVFGEEVSKVPLGNRTLALQENHAVQVIGRRTVDGTVLATSLYIEP